MMAERNCTQTQVTRCQTSRLQRRRELEDMPTARVAAGDSQESSCRGWSETLALLERQNELLCDILGALNAMTAAQLAQQQKL